MPTLPFTPTHRQQLIDALLDAFATRDELDRLVWAAFERNPQTIIAERVNLTRAVEEVVEEAASRKDGIRRLLIVATEQRTQHVELAQLSQTWSSITFAVTPRPAQPPSQISEVMRANPRFFFLNVPPMPANFVGRDELVVQLVSQLCSGKSTALSADGLPGVGKTTLAVALARHPQILSHFSDGVLWAGLGQTPDVASIQASWAEPLGAEIREILDPYQRMARISNAVGLRKLLIVIDDAWQLEAARQLRCNAPNVVHLLTTRNQELARSFAGARQQLAVPLLRSQPSYELLQTLAPEAWASDPAAAQALADKVDGLPLALELLGGYLSGSSQRRTAQRRQQALYHLSDPAARLSLATQRLGDNRGQQVTLEQIIALSLKDLSNETVTCFYSLGAFAPKPAHFDVPAALAVSQGSEEDLLTLADCNLLEWGNDETLALHQTLADLARTDLSTDATERHRYYYLALVTKNQENWQFIESIYPQVNFAWQQLKEIDLVTAQFSSALSDFQRRRGLWQDRLNWLEVAHRSAQLLHDEPAMARILNDMGYLHCTFGHFDEALDLYQQALTLWQKTMNKGGEATTLNNLGGIHSILGDRQKALDLFEQALQIRREINDKDGEASSLNNIAGLYVDSNDKGRALEIYKQAFTMWKSIGSNSGLSIALGNTAKIYSDMGNKTVALELYKQSLAIQQQIGDVTGEATILSNIGVIYDALGNHKRAIKCFKQALYLTRKIRDKSSQAHALNNLGAVYEKCGQEHRALEIYEESLILRKQVGDRQGERVACHNIGIVYQSIGNLEEAERFLTRTIELDEAIQHPDLEYDRIVLGKIRAQRMAK